MENVTLPEETLGALRHTRSLFLCSRNLFSFGQIRYLEHMTQLSSINVHMNAISRIESLGHLKHLTELDVSANELRAVDEDAFRGLTQLKRLNLSSNFLTTMAGLQHLPALEWISVSFNEIEDARGLRQLPCPQKLLHLDICGNKIATLVDLENALENCRNLQELCVETPRTALASSIVVPKVHLRENPLCAAAPNYAEQLLQRFQRLVILNGVPCRFDPTADTRQRGSVATAGNSDDRSYRHLPDLTPFSVVGSHVTPTPSLPYPHFYPHHFEAGLDDVVAAGLAANASSVSENVECSPTPTTGASSSGSDRTKNQSTVEGRASLLSWRAKRVSRAVLTTVSIPFRNEASALGAEDEILREEVRAKTELIGHLELKFKRLQEQLLLRVALEQDLRSNFESVRQAHVELIESSASEKKLLCRQVEALKDELSRRTEEATILQRKNRVELEQQTTALRAELQRQKKESSVAVRQLNDELARARKERSDGVKKLKLLLDDALQQNKRLEQENEETRVYLKKLQSESQTNKTALRACEARLCLLDEQLQLQLEESLTRRQLEHGAWSGVLTAVAVQFGLLRRANESLVVNQQKHQKAWEEYTVSLQRHYEEALLRSRLTRVAPPPARADVGCDPIALLTREQEIKREEQEAEMRRLETALSLARQSELLLSSENDRLLRCVGEKERELADTTQRLHLAEAATQKVQDDLGRERDNLLRTVHNLREAVEKKDMALDELEEEAKVKISEKRSTIAKLEARLEEAEEEAASHRHDAAKLCSALEELQRVKTELKSLQQESVNAAAGRTPCPEFVELTEALEETKRKLTSSMVREHQQSLKLTRAAETLTLVRGQLARVDEANRSLTKELDDTTAQLSAVRAEHARLQTQWQESQQAARVRQRATLQALSQIMEAGNGDEL